MWDDVWGSGDITLYLGNSSNILPAMQNLRVDAVITDPPYGLDAAEKTRFHNEFMRVAAGPVAVFAPPENQWEAGADQILFWIKPISTKNTSRRYSRFVEMIHLYRSIGTLKSGRHWSQYTNTFHDLVDDKLHPYVKPVSLITRLIRNHTDQGNVVLDPFAGSGTTGVACARTNRKFIGVEIERGCFELAKEQISEELK